MCRKNLRFITNIYIGYYQQKYYQHKIGKTEDNVFRLYLDGVETTEHILDECPAGTVQRLKKLGEEYLTPKQNKELMPEKIAAFIKDMKLLQEEDSNSWFAIDFLGSVDKSVHNTYKSIN